MKSYFDTEIKNIVQELLLVFDYKVYGIYYLGEVEKNKHSYSSFFYFKSNEHETLKDAYSLVREYGMSEQDYENYFDKINSTLVKLYDAFISDKQSPWDAIEIIYQNGKITGKLKYDWFNNDRTPIERRLIWAYESLNVVPAKDSYSEKLLKKYIACKGSDNS